MSLNTPPCAIAHDVSLLLDRVLPSVPPVDMGKYSPLAAGAGALQLY